MAKWLGEPVEAATQVNAKQSVVDVLFGPSSTEFLMISSGRLRIFAFGRWGGPGKEVFNCLCSKITRIERRIGRRKDQVRVTCADGREAEFKTTVWMRGRDVIDLLPSQSLVSIEPFSES
jgi:hypothetical protein